MPNESRDAAPARSNRLRWTLLAAYVGLIIYGSLFPVSGWRTPADFHRLFGATAPGHVSTIDVVANILLYMPLGFLAALHRHPRRIPLILLTGMVISLGLEIAQAYLPGRVASWLDVAANVSGAGMGALMAVVAVAVMPWPWLGGFLDLTARLREDRVAWLGIAALAAWAFTQLIPLAPSLDVSNLKASLMPLWQWLQGSRSLDLWRCAIYIAATSVLTVTGASVLRTPRWGSGGALGLLALLPLKALVVGRQLSPEALFGTVAGVVLGMTMWRYGRRGAMKIAVVLVPACIVADAMHPGTPDHVIHAINWMPLHAQITRPVNGLTHLADTLWPSFALAFLALRLGVRSLWHAFPAMVVLWIAAEWLQQWIPGRHPDITTVLVGAAAWAMAGIYAGHVATRSVGLKHASRVDSPAMRGDKRRP